MNGDSNPEDLPLGTENSIKVSAKIAGGKSTTETEATINAKRRCVSTACIACRRRKSKCDGNLPKCAACAVVYLTECEYAPHTDHRRKGVYKKDADPSKTKQSTMQILIQALLNCQEDEAFDLVRQIRSCDNLESLAKTVQKKERQFTIGSSDGPDTPESSQHNEDKEVQRFEAELSTRMGDLVIDGSVKFIGGTSNLIWLTGSDLASTASLPPQVSNIVRPQEETLTSWTSVTTDKDLILHFMNMYFSWHYPYFTTLSKEPFYRDFLAGISSQYCSPLLVNVMLALGCHFSSEPAARANANDSSTTGDHFFAEAKRLLIHDDELVTPRLCTVQALALMSVREAGCGREGKGWVYSGMSFRMASDLGLNVDSENVDIFAKLSDEDIDARRITFWGCFLFDKCWSNYLGRQPQLIPTSVVVKKPDVFPSEDAQMWSPYTDTGVSSVHTQPARTRAVALELYKLGEISSDLLTAFYHPQNLPNPPTKQTELHNLSDIHTRLEAWRKDLPLEMEPKDGQLPQVILMHMFYQLLYIHLYRPFLKYTKTSSPLPAHISPRKFCTQAASAISKLLRLYKRTYGLRQICNIAVYIAHSACTIHLLNLPDKNATRDIIHGVKQLEEIGECWTCARRTLRVIALCAEKWSIDLPDETAATIDRCSLRWPVETSMSPASPDSGNNFAPKLQTNVAQEPIQPNTVEQLQLRQNKQRLPTQVPAFTPGVSARESSIPLPGDRHSNSSLTVSDSARNLAPDMQSLPNKVSASSRNSAALQLTNAQREAWNSHQARMNQLAFSREKPIDFNSNPESLFGGVDSLMEESRDWWLNDQSQLARGFDNWNLSFKADWYRNDSSFAASASAENGMASTSIASAPIYGDPMMPGDLPPIASVHARIGLDGSATSHDNRPDQMQQIIYKT